MEKILLAIDSNSLNMNALDFACYLSRLTKSTLTGIFLENKSLEEKPVLKQLYGMPYVETIIESDLPGYSEKRRRTGENIQFFKTACSDRGVQCSIECVEGDPERKLISETRFADLLVISPETSFAKNFEGTPTKFVKNILENAECPVVISPEGFDSIEEIIFAYDGSRCSTFALKQFTYLFPEYKNKKAIVLEVSESGSASVAEKQKITEWLNAHYTSIEFIVLQGKAKDEIFGYLLAKKNVFAVVGAYGRSFISNLFKSSRAELVIKAISLPVFIAH